MNFGRRFGIIVGALSVAALLWSYVHLSQSYEADVELPISVKPPQGLALATRLPQTLHTRIKGAGWQIIMMSFTKNSHFALDLSERDIKSIPGGSLMLHFDDLSHNVILPSEVKLMKVEPDSLQLVFGTVIKKRIPLRIPMDVTPANGFAIVGSPVVSPATILVEGTNTILDSLTSFPTALLVKHGARENVTATLELSDTLANEVAVPLAQPITVTVNIQAVAERTFIGIPIEVEDVPPDKEVLLLPGEDTVTVRGGVDQLANLSSSKIRVHVMYDAIAFDTLETIVPTIEVPNGVSFVISAPERIRFVVRKRNQSNDAHR